MLLVYFNRKKLTKEASFVYLYKTKIGLHLMDVISNKFRKVIKIWGYFCILIAFLGFFFVGYMLMLSAYDLIVEKPGAVGGSPVIPGLPIAGLGITFPLVIGWISLFIIMIVHEFSHGVVARAHNLKVKSSGIAFFGPILGAFVEPDEKELVKQPHRVQHSVFAAGPVSNVILWLVCLVLLFGAASIVLGMTYTNGVKVGIIKNETLPAFISGLPENSIITQVNNFTITNLTNLGNALDAISPGQEVIVKTKEGQIYSMTATKNPANESKAYIGIWLLDENRLLKKDDFLNKILYKIMMWVIELLQWTGFISINIGLINLFPIFITDGARMLKIALDSIFKNDEKKSQAVWKNLNIAALLVIAILIFLPLVRNLFRLIFGFL